MNKLSRRGFLGGLFGTIVALNIPEVKAQEPPKKPDIAPYKGVTSFDAGVFYCPYIPLQM